MKRRRHTTPPQSWKTKGDRSAVVTDVGITSSLVVRGRAPSSGSPQWQRSWSFLGPCDYCLFLILFFFSAAQHNATIVGHFVVVVILVSFRFPFLFNFFTPHSVVATLKRIPEILDVRRARCHIDVGWAVSITTIPQMVFFAFCFPLRARLFAKERRTVHAFI